MMKQLAAVLFVSILILGCSVESESPKPSTESVQVRGTGKGSIGADAHSIEREPVNWKKHEDPAGFRVAFPDGWVLRQDPKTGKIAISAEPASVIVWPLFLSSQSLNGETSQSLIRELAKQSFPELHWDQVEAGKGFVRMKGIGKRSTGVAILYWIESSKGTAASFYGASAETKKYEALEGTFAQIFQSFELYGKEPQGKAQEPQIVWRNWQDPIEQAFSFEVPRSWNIEGGLFRVSPIDVRPSIVILSPDNQTRISIGDANIPVFSEPTPQGEMLGFVEGTWYTPGPGSTMMIGRYQTGAQFAANYVTSVIQKTCGNIQIITGRDRSDLVQAINAVYAQYNTGMTFALTAGETSFNCNVQGRNYEGYYLAATKRTQAYSTAIWNIEYLYGFIAPPEKTGEAAAVLSHIAQTSRLNPQWVQMQQGITANTSAIAARNSEEISKIISSSYWKQQQTYDELSVRRSNAILGVQDVFDPSTGTQYQVESGSNYYWIDHRGTIIGTNSNTRPNIDFRELTNLQ